MKTVVDFETYYDGETSVTLQGTRNYVRDADAYIVGIVADDFEWCGEIKAGAERMENMRQDPSLSFWAANSNFDQGFTEKHYGPVVHPWQCALDLGAFHQLPRSLENAVRVHLKQKMDKSAREEMKGVRWESLSPERKQRMIAYCLEDCRNTKKLIETLPPMSPLEAELAAHTRLLNRRGIHVRVDRIERDLQFLEQIRFNAIHELPWVERGEAPLSYDQFSEYCESFGVAAPVSLDKRDLRCDAWMKANPELGKLVETMRVVRGSNPKIEKLKSIVANADDNNIIPLDLLYCGARHTRRWSSVNINVQNLDAKAAYVEETKALSYFQSHPEEEPGIFMRRYFIPPPGKRFGILDYSQVEPRCLNWLVNNEAMLSAMRAGYAIYEAHALATMGWKGQPNTLKHSDPDLYKFAKIRVLALGYGMGWLKFQAKAALPPELQGIGVVLTDEQAKSQVSKFRRDNPKIVGLWRQFDTLIHSAALDKQRILELEMPTGDKLTHFCVRGKGRGMGFESYTIRGDFSQQSHQDKLWGGVLTENITQRMARDLLGAAIIRMEKAGIPIVFHAHDEIIFLLDSSSATKDFEEAKRIMAETPEWCSDVPIAVDGGIFDHYTKLQ